LDPETPVVSEEAASAGRIPSVSTRFYLVDPLDGTKEFITRNGEFTVNIALIVQGLPQAGVVYAPAMQRLFWGEVDVGAAHGLVEDSKAQSWTEIRVRPAPKTGQTIVASRSHHDAQTEKYLQGFPGARIVSAGSSLKFCFVAAGEADLYPRFGRTMEWDTAAGHAVLAAAGGKVLTIDGRPLTYGKRQQGFDNPAFIASA
jgi:3'(2'),5'-bisphosphate nucleotidase